METNVCHIGNKSVKLESLIKIGFAPAAQVNCLAVASASGKRPPPAAPLIAALKPAPS